MLIRSPKALLLLCLGLLLGAGPADLEGTGESPVIGGSVASARSRALGSAQRDCLSRAVAAQLGAERAAGEGQRLAPILVGPERFVRSYKVLDEGEQGARFFVRLACEIDVGRLRRAMEATLGLALSPPAASRLWILYLEINPRTNAELGKGLLRRARRLIEQNGLQLTAAAPLGVLSESTAARLELSLTRSHEPSLRGLGWPARRATAELRISPGGLIATAEAFGVAPFAVLAERKALEEAVDRVLGSALPLLREGANSATVRFELRVRGLQSVAALQELQRVLAETGATAKLRSVDNQDVLFSIEVVGGVTALAAGLRNYRFAKSSLTQLQLAGGALWLTFASAR